MGKRIFDVAGAREMLPLVKRIAADLQASETASILAERRSTAAGEAGDKPESWRQADIAEAQRKETLRLTNELASLNVHLIDAVRGEVGFPSIINGALAYLVLHGDDGDIRHWRYCDQPRLRDIPKSWYQTPVVRETEPELVLD